MLAPCTNRRCSVLLPAMPLLCCTPNMPGQQQSSEMLLAIWWHAYIDEQPEHKIIQSAPRIMEFGQTGLIPSLPFTAVRTPNGLGRLKEVLQRQELKKLVAATAYEDTEHFLTWFAFSQYTLCLRHGDRYRCWPDSSRHSI